VKDTLVRNAPAKPAKGSYKRERVARSLQRENKEDAAKRLAKKRDGHCRWPHATTVDRVVCRQSHLEAAHYKGKGMGGNKDGSRNVRKNLITFCLEVHNPLYPNSIHAGRKRVRALTPELMDGPCAFDEKRAGRWVEVGQEISVGVLA
jgi:hypothetical protein